jgi:hypothetical protein
MNVFKELETVEDYQLKIKNMTDNILESYKKNPKECNRLLKELAVIDKELKELAKQFSKYI